MYPQAEQEAATRPYRDARTTATPATLSKARLPQQLDELDKILSGCHELAGDLDRAADRILGSVPQDASKSAPQPEPSSIEARLQAAIGYAERLATRLHSTSQRMNSAA